MAAPIRLVPLQRGVRRPVLFAVLPHPGAAGALVPNRRNGHTELHAGRKVEFPPTLTPARTRTLFSHRRIASPKLLVFTAFPAVRCLLISPPLFSHRVEVGIPKSQNYPHYDQCHRKDLDFSAVLSHGIRSVEWKTNKTVGCSRWEYNFTQIPYASIAAEVKYPRVYVKTRQ